MIYYLSLFLYHHFILQEQAQQAHTSLVQMLQEEKAGPKL